MILWWVLSLTSIRCNIVSWEEGRQFWQERHRLLLALDHFFCVFAVWFLLISPRDFSRWIINWSPCQFFMVIELCRNLPRIIFWFLRRELLHILLFANLRLSSSIGDWAGKTQLAFISSLHLSFFHHFDCA